MVTSNFAEAGAFVKSRPELALPDLQLVFVLALIGNRNMEKRSKLGHGYSCHACVLRPASRGHVRLKSRDMRDAPLIDPQFLTADSDMETLVAGVRTIRRILAQPALAEFGGKATPGAMVASMMKRRPFSGSCLTCSFSITVPRLAVSTRTTGESPTTVTFS